MPRMNKWIGKKNMSIHQTMSVTTRLMSSAERTAKSRSQEPMSSVERRATSRTREEMSSTTRTTTKKKMLVPMHPVQSIIVQLILIMIWILKTIQRSLTTSHFLQPISPQSSMLSSVTFLRKAPAQGMTTKIFHILVSRKLVFYVYHGSYR